MKKVIPNVLSEEEAKHLIKNPKDETILKKIKNTIDDVIGPINWDKPSYIRVESNGHHSWHFDTGGKSYGNGHMAWCEYGCSVLLTQGDCGELEYRDGTKLNHYLDLAIHSSDEEHRVTDYKGERVTLLAFVRSLK